MVIIGVNSGRKSNVSHHNFLDDSCQHLSLAIETSSAMNNFCYVHKANVLPTISIISCSTALLPCLFPDPLETYCWEVLSGLSVNVFIIKYPEYIEFQTSGGGGGGAWKHSTEMELLCCSATNIFYFVRLFSSLSDKQMGPIFILSGRSFQAICGYQMSRFGLLDVYALV